MQFGNNGADVSTFAWTTPVSDESLSTRSLRCCRSITKMRWVPRCELHSHLRHKPIHPYHLRYCAGLRIDQTAAEDDDSQRSAFRCRGWVCTCDHSRFLSLLCRSGLPCSPRRCWPSKTYKHCWGICRGSCRWLSCSWTEPKGNVRLTSPHKSIQPILSVFSSVYQVYSSVLDQTGRYMGCGAWMRFTEGWSCAGHPGEGATRQDFRGMQDPIWLYCLQPSRI